MIKNIVFDMGGVLISFDAQRYTARFVPDPADYELIRRELFRSVEWIRMDRGTLGQEEAVAAMEARLPRHLREYARRSGCTGRCGISWTTGTGTSPLWTAFMIW